VYTCEFREVFEATTYFYIADSDMQLNNTHTHTHTHTTCIVAFPLQQ